MQSLDFCFKRCPDSVLLVKDGKAKWCHKQSRLPTKQIENKPCLFFDITLVKKSIDYLLDNCYFTIGNRIYRQIIGIPMGSDPAPFMANLFLYYYENQFIGKLRKEKNNLMYKFGNIFRFIDDLCAINDGGEFGKHIAEIYPSELELKKENIGFDEATFLDLGISIKDRKFTYKLYDKRNDFGFSIVRMPFLTNNMPSRIFYSTYMSEFLRIAKCSSGRYEYEESAMQLWVKYCENKPDLRKSRKAFSKLYQRHQHVFNEFYSSSVLFCREMVFGCERWHNGVLFETL